MKVWIDALQAGNRSGTGRYTAELIRALCGLEDGPELTVAWPDGLAPAEGIAAAEIRPFHAEALQRVWTDQWRLPRLAGKGAAEILHYPANVGALFPGGARTVVTVHDLSFCRHPEWFRGLRAAYYRHAVIHSARKAARVIADSRATAEDLARFAGIPETLVEVVPLGVSPWFSPASSERCGEVRRRYALPERFFLYVGAIEPRKNLVRLIEAWSRLAGKPETPDLVIAGREGWKTGPIHDAAARASRPGGIHFPGYIVQEDLPALISAAHAFVWPSLFEGFGLPVIEAMACGAPVLTSEVSSLPEVAGEAAVLVNPEDTAAIAEGLEALAGDASLRKRLSEAGKKRAALFTWERTARLTLPVYQRALGA